MALRLSAEVAADVLDAERAATDYRAALALASELGMHPLAAHCHLGLGKLYRCTSKREQAQEHLTTATTMYREMDMRLPPMPLSPLRRRQKVGVYATI